MSEVTKKVANCVNGNLFDSLHHENVENGMLQENGMLCSFFVNLDITRRNSIV
jgi:hypothetical protein